jgi:hypothetical protein
MRKGCDAILLRIVLPVSTDKAVITSNPFIKSVSAYVLVDWQSSIKVDGLRGKGQVGIRFSRRPTIFFFLKKYPSKH